jgi:hypothetical protein
MSCQHRNIVVVGSDETGTSSVRCSDCRAPLTRRIESGEYIYVVCDDQDNARAVSASRNRRVHP